MHVYETSSVHRPLARPAADILEQDDRILVLVNMPGVPDEDVMVEVEHGVLSIRGLSRCGCDMAGVKTSHNDKTVLALEFVDVEYSLRVALSEALDANAIRAILRNGVLSISLPCRHDGPRRIFVENR